MKIKGGAIIWAFTLILLIIPCKLFSQDVIAYIGEVGGEVTVEKLLAFPVIRVP